jgi:hypothetical protein
MHFFLITAAAHYPIAIRTHRQDELDLFKKTSHSVRAGPTLPGEDAPAWGLTVLME